VQNGAVVLLGQLRPHFIHEKHFRVSHLSALLKEFGIIIKLVTSEGRQINVADLPEQEVGKPVFSGGPDQNVRIWVQRYEKENNEQTKRDMAGGILVRHYPDNREC